MSVRRVFRMKMCTFGCVDSRRKFDEALTGKSKDLKNTENLFGAAS